MKMKTNLWGVNETLSNRGKRSHIERSLAYDFVQTTNEEEKKTQKRNGKKITKFNKGKRPMMVYVCILIVCLQGCAIVHF